MTKKAIVTLAIGVRYAENFERYCRKDWTAYAERHGCDVIVFKAPLDHSARALARSPAWQKCLILGALGMAQYDQVAWVDSDIAIHPLAPSLFAGVPEDRIGATDEHAYPSPDVRQGILAGLIAGAPTEGAFGRPYWQAWTDPGAWHAAAGFPSGQAHIVQTGVLVLSPRHHRDVLEHVYRSHEDCGLNYEMRALSYEIQKRQLQHWIDPRFNALIWWLFLAGNIQGRIESEDELRQFAREAYRRSYFLHFAGAANLMPLLG